jgi:hypothetical protein
MYRKAVGVLGILAKGFISHVLDIFTLFMMNNIMILINFLEQFHLVSYLQVLFGKNIITSI